MLLSQGALALRATRLVLFTSSAELPKYLGPLKLHSMYPLTQAPIPLMYSETAVSISGPQLGNFPLHMSNSLT